MKRILILTVVAMMGCDRDRQHSKVDVNAVGSDPQKPPLSIEAETRQPQNGSHDQPEESTKAPAHGQEGAPWSPKRDPESSVAYRWAQSYLEHAESIIGAQEQDQ